MTRHIAGALLLTAAIAAYRRQFEVAAVFFGISCYLVMHTH